MNKGKVVVGMSGGVDSSVAALILKEQGYDVTGVTMQIWQGEGWEQTSENGGCCGLSAVEDARRVAEIIGIPHYVMNFRDEFQSKVIDYFIGEYRKGRTPNPCIACNRYIKWEALLHRAFEIGADYIATGHYGRIVRLDNGRYSVAKSVSLNKDQSYVLYSLTQDELAHTLFPLCGYEKDEVRRLAVEAGLPVADKKDSQDICFVPDGDYAAFIEGQTGQKGVPGNFVDTDGNVLGQHRGITHYTVGQRKGLGIAFGEPRFVLRINPADNTVVLGTADELMARRVRIVDVNYMACTELTGEVRVTGKLRYSQKESTCTIRPSGNGIIAEFDEPQRAATPGQAAVFYENDCVLCGGVIEEDAVRG